MLCWSSHQDYRAWELRHIKMIASLPVFSAFGTVIIARWTFDFNAFCIFARTHGSAIKYTVSADLPCIIPLLTPSCRSPIFRILVVANLRFVTFRYEN